MSLDEKIFAARRLIATVLSQNARPVVMSSFGKDSMVLLHLVHSLDKSIPVVFHREPFMARKYAFANRVIEAWDLTVFDYRPFSVAVCKVDDEMEIINYYQNGWREGQPTVTHVPTGLVAPVAGEPFLCGKADLLEKPCGTFNWPWDLAFIGHKASDSDKVNGAVPVQVDVLNTPGAVSFAFPLREFNDADIWAYHELHQLPRHDERYDPASGFAERADKRDNPDYFECCTLCFDRDQPATVRCPKDGLLKNNIQAQVRYVPPIALDYFKPPIKACA